MSSSSSETDEDCGEPFAYVYYQAGDSEIVPISFILHFPKNWSEPATEGGGWDRNYLYKVFWSPDDEDTPAKMLQRIDEIPVHDKGSSQETAGYYRASVERVKGTHISSSLWTPLCLPSYLDSTYLTSLALV